MTLLMKLDVTFVKEIIVTYIEISDKANDSMAKLMQVIQAVKIKGDVSILVIENTILFIETKF